MPRKTKEQKELERKAPPSPQVAKPLLQKTTSTKKKSATKEVTKKKNTQTTKNKNLDNASTTGKKNASTQKTTTKKTTNQKGTSTTKKKTHKKELEILEYYDLPYRYNQTVVKVLAQTPTNLFIYWDISDKDRKNFQKQYGEDFFEITKPILIVYNDTLGYQFEVEINDFANSWYLHVANSKCEYRIELGRKPIQKAQPLPTDYIYVTTSNEIESPNDKILLNPQQKMVYFKNVKTGIETKKTTASISFLRNMGKIYTIYDLYQTIYKEEQLETLYHLSNPSSESLLSKF